MKFTNDLQDQEKRQFGLRDRRGIAMTEYLIILAIVAVASIVVVGFFGQSIKNTFARATQAGQGTVTTTDNSSAINSGAVKQAAAIDDMNSFDKNKNTATSP